jgi:hypothetical protein
MFNYNEERQKYIAGKISYRKFYTLVGKELGVTKEDFPSSVKIGIKKFEKGEISLAALKVMIEAIPLIEWDKQDMNIRALGLKKGILGWSLCETVCVLKVAVDNYLENLK